MLILGVGRTPSSSRPTARAATSAKISFTLPSYPAPCPAELDRKDDGVAYRLLRAAEAYWRPSNQMSVLNTDLGKQLEASSLGARLWRLKPGQASTRHRHFDQEELYVLLEGSGRIRVDGDLLVLAPLDSLLVEPSSARQVFNDTDDDQLWLVVGAPPELANTLEMSEEQLRVLYPDGPRAMPPELDA